MLLLLLGIMIYILLLYEAQRRGGKESFSFISQFGKPKEEPIVESNSETYVTPEKEIYPLFVGDSRTVGMATVMEKTLPYIDYHAKSGSSFYYFKSLDSRVRSSGADCLVIGFGVNDLNDIDKYTEYANTLGEELTMPVYFLTVNPVEEDKASRHGYYVKEKKVEEFNAALFEKAVNYTVIDTNSYLMGKGFSTMDGLHYTDETYEDIYYFILEFLQLHS